MELEKLIEKLKNGEDIVMYEFKTKDNSPLVYGEWVTLTKDDYSIREENGEYYVKFKKGWKVEPKVSDIYKYVKGE